LWTALLAVGCAAGVARAAEPVVGGEAFFSFNTHRMKQINDLVAAFNHTGSDFPKIDQDLSGGLGVRFWATPRWLLTATWEGLYGETQGTLAGVDTTGSPFAVDLRYNLDGKAVNLGAAYVFPSSRAVRLGLGAAVGYYWVRGVAETSHQDGSLAENFVGSEPLRGRTVGIQAGGLAEWTITPGIGATTWVGYRQAKIADTRVAGISASPKLETDYSGFSGHLGVVFYLPQRQ
jgi:hypothetical protein